MPSTAGESTLKALEGKRLDRCVGRPSNESVDETRREIAKEYAKAKTTHTDFPLGKQLGYAAAILKPTDYIPLHNKLEADPTNYLNAGWQFNNPVRLARYDSTITGAMLEATRKNREDKREEMLEQWDIFDAYESKYRDLIEEAYDETYIKALKEDFLGYSNRSVREMLDELDSHCLALTTNEKQAKLKTAEVPWDQDEDTDVFFNSLDECEKKLKALEIEWPISHKITHAVTQMTTSGVFTEDDIMDWEDKVEADKTWVHCQTYWNKIFKKRKRFNNLKPKQHGFEGAANVEERPPNEMSREELSQSLRDISEAATADKEHIQQMSTTTDEMLFIVKKQQSQIDKLVETNSLLTATIAKLSKEPNTRNPRNNPGTNPNSGNNNREKGVKEKEEGKSAKQKEIDKQVKDGHGCGICGRHKFTQDCFELISNKDKRGPNWKSIFE